MASQAEGEARDLPTTPVGRHVAARRVLRSVARRGSASSLSGYIQGVAVNIEELKKMAQEQNLANRVIKPEPKRRHPMYCPWCEARKALKQ